jgi:hypothetical protein
VFQFAKASGPLPMLVPKPVGKTDEDPKVTTTH